MDGAHMEQATRGPQFKLPWWPALSIPPASPIPQEGPGRGEGGIMTPGGSRMKWGSWVPRRVQAKLGVMTPGRPRMKGGGCVPRRIQAEVGVVSPGRSRPRAGSPQFGA